MSDHSPSAPAPAAGSGFAADLRAGFLVFLIALPLCLGIAMASGFPPIAGVMTAIIGGILGTALGSSRLTIKGPAAGLIVIAIGAVMELGHGDMQLGYERTLAVGAVAAGVQILFALFRAATVGIAMSPSVVHGMLAAIGVIIVAKQSHTVIGVTPEAKEPIELLLEIPHSIAHCNPEIFIVGGVSLLILFGWQFLRTRWAKVIPPQLVVLLIAVPAALWFDLPHSHSYDFLSGHYQVGPEYLVQLPGNLLDAITHPDFSVVFTGPSLKYIVMFALVGMIESVLSVLAVDAMDPLKRASNLNRDLLTIGIANLACAFVGGLPMISEIVRSKANIDAGAVSSRANLVHGVLLLVFVAALPGLLQTIPLAALGAMLVYTGTRLASPSEFQHAKELG
ncbi:MAG TPA: SulP family inorganic anion transporter, partial [bacterium]|nr:SulP family inorganic anion transporter [bacterium]